jgi:hypothetical protein
MQVVEVADLLEKLEAGGEVEIGSSELIGGVIDAGLACVVPDREEERTRLSGLQAQLRAAPDEAARRALRGEILALSEALAMASSGVVVSGPEGGSAYRGGPAGNGTRRIAVTQRGRAFLSDVKPRAERVASLDVASFEREMEALRATLRDRARRAAAIATEIAKISIFPSSGAWRSAAIGLAASRGPEGRVAERFHRVVERIGRRLAPWTTEQGVSAAECICLVAPSIEDVDVAGDVAALLDLRDQLLAGPCANEPEHALDASVILAGNPYEKRSDLLADATRLVDRSTKLGARIPLPTALLCVSTGATANEELISRLRALAPRLTGGDTDARAATDALALGLATGIDPDVVVDRIVAHRVQLARFAPHASTTAAALLAWIDAPLAETLDDLRLCAAAVQTHRLAIDPGETAGNAVKLLLVSALLGTGAEGDAEEKLALALRPHARIASLGVGTVSASVPLLVGVTSAFVQPLLDAAAIWDAHRRTTQGYVHHHHYYG